MRILPENFLSYPVAVTVGRSGGSGFLLDKDNTLYVVSAKHVFYDGANLFDQKARFTVVHGSAKAAITADLVAAGVKPHADVVAVKIADVDPVTRAAMPSAGITFPDRTALPADFALIGVSANECIKFDDVFIGNDVFVFGYPNSIGLKDPQNPANDQLDPARPLLRKGAVADKDPGKGHIVIDCPLYKGNSGGLVLERRRLHNVIAIDPTTIPAKTGAIGVATGFVPFIEMFQSLHYGTINTAWENSGYAIVTPIDRVLELI